MIDSIEQFKKGNKIEMNALKTALETKVNELKSKDA